MQEAGFRCVLYGVPQDYFAFIFMAGTCEEADDTARWHMSLYIRANTVSPWLNPQEIHGGQNGAVVKLHLWKDGGEVIHTFTDLEAHVWRDTNGKPWRIFVESENDTITLDTGYPGQTEAETYHARVEVSLGVNTFFEEICPGDLQAEQGVIP